MEFLTLLLIAIGLSFDSFAVSISCGLVVRNIRFNNAFRMAFIFAVVQGMCFFAGCLLGQSLRGLISSYDHWVAFALLFIIGGKMIYESIFAKNNGKDCRKYNPLKLSSTFLIAIATSIDAIIIGLGIALIDISLHQLSIAVCVIAFVTGFAAMLGLLIGKKTGRHIGGKAEIIGGVVLIGIGAKILIEHIST
ncbi:MAG: manganese efflux pump MntP family protein [Prevotellaceae bacterium]|jgi:putative Mn2+ efflux pump MntP|nr:manganese efflux pump MntP family protein [Prevotellaceae bacterium]